jgi:hypothetical protein
MSIEKSVIKIGTIQELGNQFDDFKEEALAEQHRNEGARSALKQAMKLFQPIFDKVEAEAKEGAFDEVEGAIAICEVVKRSLKRVLGALDGLATQANVNRLVQEGKVAGYERVIKVSKKALDTEIAKKTAQENGENESNLTPLGEEPTDPRIKGRAGGQTVSERSAGIRPGLSIAAQRKSEDVTETTEENTSVTPDQEAQLPQEKASDIPPPVSASIGNGRSSKKTSSKPGAKRRGRPRKVT